MSVEGVICAGAYELQTIEVNIDQELRVEENLTFQLRSPFPQQGDLVRIDGMLFQVLSVGPDGTYDLRPAHSDQIRGLSSNAVIYDEVMDLDEETMRRVAEGFAEPDVEVEQDFEPVAEPLDGHPSLRFMDISYVNRPADRVGFINNADEMRREFGPPYMP